MFILFMHSDPHDIPTIFILPFIRSRYAHSFAQAMRSRPDRREGDPALASNAGAGAE